MTEEQKVQIEPEKVKPKNVVCVGIDVGTMHLACARSDSDQTKMTRNVFLSVDKDLINLSQLSKISYVEGEDGQIFIIGTDAFEFANLFGKEVSRPMAKGLISPKEIAAIDVLSLMIKDLIGDIKDKDVYCSYSIPAESIDEGRSVTYHENVFARILNTLGINYKSVNEAMAIIYSECAAENFSGIAISFGAGMANSCLAYKGIEAHKFSTARAGDWIDQRVAESLAMIPNRVTNIKEKYMKFSGEVEIKNKKTQRVLEALYYYHKELIEYTVKKIIKEFEQKVDIEVGDKLPIVISGGTSMPEGFDNMFKSVLANYELPFEISEVRRAKNPLTAVANGLLVKTMADVQTMRK